MSVSEDAPALTEPEEPGSVDLSTLDLAAGKRAALEELFPGVLADGVLDAARLGELLDTPVTAPAEGRERFGLMWAGKQDAVRSLLTPSWAALVPAFDKSIGFETAENVFIEGDNLEVLKLLQKAYNDKIKFIYIDPPYNTGNDFVYNDDLSDGLRGYLQFTGQLDEEGKRTSASAELLGRRHSRWLSMMYPRLVLARNLLSHDGFFFVSINDLEAAPLRLMCDEIFGEENFIEAFFWQSIFRPSNMSRRVRRNAEYILCYRRNAADDFELVERLEDPKGEASLTQNNNAVRTLCFPAGSLVVKLADGRYPRGAVGDVELVDDLVVAAGRSAEDFRIAGRFKWSQEYLDQEIEKGVYLAIKTKTFIPYYRKDYQRTALRPTKILPRDLVGDVLQANAEVSKTLGEGIFEYPKPTSLIRFLMRMVGVSDDELVLDFFAGSGTTAHAVMLENEADGGSRRSISVNLPEPIDESSAAGSAGLRTVSDITRARIVGSMEGIESAKSQGLRAFELKESHFFTPADGPRDDILNLSPRTIRDAEVNLDALAGEVLLKEGVALDAAWERHSVGDAEVIIAEGVAIVLSLEITDDVVTGAIGLEPRVLVFLEDGFAGKDAVKANAFTNARNLGITMKTV
jgi:adenine-specific DNA-methyltransferase